MLLWITATKQGMTLALHFSIERPLAPRSRTLCPQEPPPCTTCTPTPAISISHSQVPSDLHASPLTPRSQRAEPHPYQGRREGAAGAHSPGKGEAHWKSQLGVSASKVTGESPHAYPCSSREETCSRGRTAGQETQACRRSRAQPRRSAAQLCLHSAWARLGTVTPFQSSKLLPAAQLFL